MHTPQPASDTDCRQTPGVIRPVIDRNRCEGKADCARVYPVGVFAVGTSPPELRTDLSMVGRIKGFAHRWQQAVLIKAPACKGCGHYMSACPEHAIKLERVR